MSGIIRPTLPAFSALALAIAIGACGAAATAAPGRPATSPSPGTGSVWVLSTVGLNLRATPDPQGGVVTLLAWGQMLRVGGGQSVGTDRWLHVTTTDGAQGWVLDRRDLVIHQPVAIHAEDTFRVLFPAGWTPRSGNPATITGPAGDRLQVQTADDPGKLPATPPAGSREVRQDPELDVYGVTTYPTVYRSQGGGFEFVVKLTSARTAYLFDYRQTARPDPDTGLFRTLLSSVILTPAT